MTTPIDLVLSKLANVQRQGKGYTARCPAHEDRLNSLKVDEGQDGRTLIYCHAGCSFGAIVAVLEMKASDLYPSDARRNGMGGGGGVYTPSNTIAQAHTLEGNNDFNSCTLTRYAEAKGLPLDFLRELGLSDMHYVGRPAIRVPYPDKDSGAPVVRFRTALLKSEHGDNRFKWKSGSKMRPYGLDRLEAARKAGYISLVEGESDCQTLWHVGEPAIGIPGASNWNELAWAPYFDGIDRIYLVVEPDKGGESLLGHVAKSRIHDRVHLLNLGEPKDPSGLYLEDQVNFKVAWLAACATAVPLVQIEQEEAEARAAAAWDLCKDLANEPDILGRFADEIEQQGLVGEWRNARILFLAVMSRLLSRPVSVAVKGPSSAGKSYLVERTLAYFPLTTYYALSAMSERALAYSQEPLEHRMLVIYEAAGMEGEFTSYLMRSLLSEGCVRYETVEKTREGIRARLIERKGPTGLIITTTAARVHAENETRLLSIQATDTCEQTERIMHALATQEPRITDPEAFARWHALQIWLETGQTDVAIPFAQTLAAMVPPIAVRLRRDFGTLLNLIRAHALLHRATRDRDEQDRIVASPQDYEAVYGLIADSMADSVDATVPDTIRETVQAVTEICSGQDIASVQEIAKRLKLDRSAAQRRVSVCLDRGYLRNIQEREGPGRPLKLTLGDALPDQQEILPHPDNLAARFAKDTLCNCAPVQEGVYNPSPSQRMAIAASVFASNEAAA